MEDHFSKRFKYMIDSAVVGEGRSLTVTQPPCELSDIEAGSGMTPPSHKEEYPLVHSFAEYSKEQQQLTVAYLRSKSCDFRDVVRILRSVFPDDVTLNIPFVQQTASSARGDPHIFLKEQADRGCLLPESLRTALDAKLSSEVVRSPMRESLPLTSIEPGTSDVSVEANARAVIESLKRIPYVKIFEFSTVAKNAKGEVLYDSGGKTLPRKAVCIQLWINAEGVEKDTLEDIHNTHDVLYANLRDGLYLLCKEGEESLSEFAPLTTLFQIIVIEKVTASFTQSEKQMVTWNSDTHTVIQQTSKTRR